MSRQIVDSDKIAATVNKLRTANSTINDEFSRMQSKAKRLDDNWKSKAGEIARTAMYELFKINELRSTVIQNYVNLLEQQVNPGYIDTEAVNTRLADKFK